MQANFQLLTGDLAIGGGLQLPVTQSWAADNIVTWREGNNLWKKKYVYPKYFYPKNTHKLPQETHHLFNKHQLFAKIVMKLPKMTLNVAKSQDNIWCNKTA